MPLIDQANYRKHRILLSTKGTGCITSVTRRIGISGCPGNVANGMRLAELFTGFEKWLCQNSHKL